MHTCEIGTQEAEANACQKRETNLDYRMRPSLKKKKKKITKQGSCFNACLTDMRASVLHPQIHMKKCWAWWSMIANQALGRQSR